RAYARREGSLGGEAFPRVSETVEQGCGRPERVPGLFLESEHRVAKGVEADRVGPEHRAASIDRPAVAIDPDDIDVAGANGDLLLEDLGAFVDHRIEQALQDLLVGDRPTRDAHLRGDVDDDLLDVGARRRVALFVALVVPGARL